MTYFYLSTKHISAFFQTIIQHLKKSQKQESHLNIYLFQPIYIKERYFLTYSCNRKQEGFTSLI